MSKLIGDQFEDDSSRNRYSNTKSKGVGYGKYIAIGIVVLIGFWMMSQYNGLITKGETVETQWAQVENVYQRKYDLIPNLVATVKQYAEHEKDVLIGVTEARSKVSSINIDPSNITPEQLQQFEAAQGELNSALSRLLVTVEKYPDLKANQSFMKLQDELSGSENRISTERRKFNEVTKTYNIAVKRFPANLVAGIFGFE